MAAALHISIAAEKLFSVGDLAITNSIFTSLIVSGMIIAFAAVVRMQLKDTTKISGLQNFAEWIVESLHNLVYGVTGNLKKTRLFLPFIGTFLLWILLNNWLGLFPGVGTIRIIEGESEVHVEGPQVVTIVRASEEVVVEETHTTGAEETVAEEHETETGEVAATEETTHEVAAAEGGHTQKAVPIFRPGSADLNTTIALALFSVFMTQVFGVQALGLGYFKKYVNFSSPIMFFVGILELVSEFAKIISFAFRLFGNIFAGEVLLVVISSLIPLVVPMPFYGLELFVGFIQALVFAMLSLVFFNMATQSHDEH